MDDADSSDGWCGGCGLVGRGGVAVPAGGQTGEVSQPFEFSGEPEDYVVPAGVCSVTVDAFGAEGGDYLGQETPTVGGLGGRVTATIPVTPGETLIVRVGGRGTDSDIPNGAIVEADGDVSAADVTIAVFGPGGFNGGGDGVTPPTTRVPVGAVAPMSVKVATRSRPRRGRGWRRWRRRDRQQPGHR